MKPKISIVLPVLNETYQLNRILPALQALRPLCELILVDGGSSEGYPAFAETMVDQLLVSEKGRARQMNAGAGKAHGNILLFLHADTLLPEQAVHRILTAVERGYRWGRFDVRFDNRQAIYRLIAFMMNRRSRLTGIATGDQGLFVTREVFAAVGGFPEIALMEDIAISDRLKKIGKPCCLHDKVTTSARRWQNHGVLKTVLLMWRLRLAYFFGADPDKLAARYYRS
ncbi:TIGR04283 family arsenosugar biosynthesis glycosyltransferase [Methylomonas sp. MgM2]